MPIRRFWFLNNQVDRLRAEQEIRQLQILACAQSSEGFKSSYDHLNTQMGKIYVWEEPKIGEIVIDPKTGLNPEFNREGLRKFKADLFRQTTKRNGAP